MIDNTLARQFDLAAPDKAWVTDITGIWTLEGFAGLAVVIDLFSRRVIGWSLQGRLATDVVLQALLMAVWRRKPQAKVLIQSDQGSPFTGPGVHKTRGYSDRRVEVLPTRGKNGVTLSHLPLSCFGSLEGAEQRAAPTAGP